MTELFDTFVSVTGNNELQGNSRNPKEGIHGDETIYTTDNIHVYLSHIVIVQ